MTADATPVSHLRPPASSELFRPLAAEMVQAVVDRVRAEVPAYAEVAGSDPCPHLEVAAREAVHAFLDGGHTAKQRKVDELFRRLGHREAQQGRDTAPMIAALMVAGRCVWDQVSDFAVSQRHSVAAFRDISAALMEYVDHLRDELRAGHELGSRFTSQKRPSARARLMDYIIHASGGRVSPLRPLGMDERELRRLATAAGWPVPESVVALSVSFHGSPPSLPERAEVLTKTGPDRIFALCPGADGEELAAQLTQSGPDRRVALSWPVQPKEAGSALLWTARALDLVRLGVITPTSLVRCTEHVTQLWLHAEPSMRQRLCQELLEPLLAETPNSREILSDTLLAWLETRDSAPAIAARLDVHPQTVRYRWKRINELFGESLHDPEFILQMTLVLKTSLLMWKAGNQSDFERFRDRKLPER